jgi:spore coat polysaccharide biosynthesis protein SpsF
MNSERLPGKVMMPVNGIPLIGILIQRLKQSGLPIILATSDNPENDILCEYVKEQDVLIFRGSEENVLERYFFAAQTVGAEYIIRVTGDNPLIDGYFIKSVIDGLDDFDRKTYFSTGINKTLPLGLSFELFSFELLEDAYNNAKLPGEKEHVTPYLHQNKPGNIKILALDNSYKKSDYRLTVDTKEDFELIKILIERYSCLTKTTDQIIDVLDDNPELAAINKGIVQKDWTDSKIKP